MKETNANNLKPRVIELFNGMISGNNVFEGFYSEDDMTDKLSNKIKVICTDEVPFNDFGEWNGRYGILSLKPEVIEGISVHTKTKEETKVILLQQLLHVVSDRDSESGLDKYRLFKDEKRKNGKSIDNGMSMELAERILGVKTNGYSKEKGVYNIFSTLYGEETFISDYITGGDTIQEHIKDNYGDTILKFFNLVIYNLDVLRIYEYKINMCCKTADKKYIVEEYKAAKDKYEGILDATLEKMIKRKLRLTPDINGKYDLLCKLKQSNYKNEIAGLNIQNAIDEILAKITEELIDEEQLTNIESKVMVATNEIGLTDIKKQAANIKQLLISQSIEKNRKQEHNQPEIGNENSYRGE